MPTGFKITKLKEDVSEYECVKLKLEEELAKPRQVSRCEERWRGKSQEGRRVLSCLMLYTLALVVLTVVD